mgnify:CR=1 FL=1
MQANFRACSNDDGWCWTYDVDFPHEVFELYDHGEKYCRGLVFYLKDIRTEILEQEEISNEELKEAIVYIATTRTFTDSFGEEMGIDIEVAKGLADALIAAGIGDINTVRDMGVKATTEAILVAAKAEHRAARAERALQKFAENITCEDCPFFSDCASSEKMEDLIHSSYCFAEYLKQAEKELAEEGKSENN